MPKSLEGQDYDIVHKQRDAEALAKDLIKLKLLPFDTETDCTRDGFDWKREKQIVWQFHDEVRKRTYLIDCRRVDVQVFKPVMESGDVVKIIQDAGFDALWTKREHDINIFNIGDTRIQENLLMGMTWPRQPPKGMSKTEFDKLKPLYSASLKETLHRRGFPAKLEFIPHYWHQPIRNDKGVVIGFDKEKLEDWTQGQIVYDIRDVEYSCEIYRQQVEELKRGKMAYLSWMENALTEVTVAMSNRGFHIDVEGYLDYALKNERVYTRVLDDLKEIKDINWGAWQQTTKYFNVGKTDDIKKLAEQAKLVDYMPDDQYYKNKALLLWDEMKEYEKSVNTYGLSYLAEHLELLPSGVGIIRSKYDQLKNTGRYSAEDPNNQQVPVQLKRGLKKIPLWFRKYWIPPPGYKLVVADFSAQELGIAAIASGEPVWLKILRAGEDLHNYTGGRILPGWNTYTDAKKKEDRRIIKDINFGSIYGLGPDGLATKAEIDVDWAREIQAAWKAEFPTLVDWLNENAEFTKRTGVSYSMPPFNRLRTTYLETESWRKANIGKNNPVQATGADMAKRALLTAHDRGAIMIHMQHDELVAIARDNEEDILRTAHTINEAMREAAIEILGEAITYPDIHVCNNWLEAKDDATKIKLAA